MAGYNPEVAVPFWKRMAEQGGSSNKNDLFSDHPSDSKRIAAIETLLPNALKYYQASGYVNNNNVVKKSTRKSIKR
jgi:predicted Zn-dependent protease